MKIQELEDLLHDVISDPRLNRNIQARTFYFENSKHEVLYVLNKVTKRLPPKFGRFLDIGSYVGLTDIALKRLGYDVFCVDVPDYVNDFYLAKRYADFEIPYRSYLAGATSISFAEEFFDAVICVEVLEHLTCNPLDLMEEVTVY